MIENIGDGANYTSSLGLGVVCFLRAFNSAYGTKNYKKRDLEIADPGISLEQYVSC